ncbi:MAG: hypothetical protein KKD07_09285 [Candidatus Omnitrophica bacterium]|nr:hypothetical protein [Candidatus Omnitrophota bacterium]MBU1996225.1 hypothetical protein [Candidatus Omnitrophota bacterium]MBU4334619.1 hypothetical protein [Candidatus Omnitrophota bacterium]
MDKRTLRKNYFIDRSFQAGFILKFCAIVIISSLFIAGLTFVFSRGSTTVAIENTKVQVKQTQDFIFPIVARVLLIVSIFSAASVGAVSLFVSHKISGPLFRIKREVDVLCEGDLKRDFNLRGDDQLQELAKSLNVMSKYLRKNHNLLKSRMSDLKAYLEKKKYVLSAEDKEPVSLIVEEISAELDKIKS